MFQTIKYTAPWLLQNLIWIPTRLFLYFFSHLKVTGLDNLKKIHGPVIFVSNHTSELDPILLPASLPFLSRFLPIFYVSREKTFYNQKVLLKRLLYGGFFFEAWGAYQAFVGLRDYEESLKNHIKILNAGHSLMIFPEGKKSFDGQIHTSESKGGAAFLCHKTKAAIVPITISGAFRTNPLEFFTFKKYFSVHFSNPIFSKDLFINDDYIEPSEYRKIIREEVMPIVENTLIK